MIHDDKAVAMVNQIDCDFSRLRMMRHDEVAVLMRMNKFDRQVRNFLERNPNAVVVHIGCGLDTRFERVDNGSVEWFDLVIPDVMALRQKLIRNESDRYHGNRQWRPRALTDAGGVDEIRGFGQVYFY